MERPKENYGNSKALWLGEEARGWDQRRVGTREGLTAGVISILQGHFTKLIETRIKR